MMAGLLVRLQTTTAKFTLDLSVREKKTLSKDMFNIFQ